MSATSPKMPAKKALLPPGWDVPDEFRNRLGTHVGRQRAMITEGQVLLVLHAPPKPEDDERQGRFFWRKADGTWSATHLGTGAAALDKHLSEFDEVIDLQDRREEAAKSVDDYIPVIEALAPLHRATRNLLATLEEARRAVPQAREIIDFRDRAYELDRRAELLYDTARNALDFAIARQSEEQARAAHGMAISAHRLNLLAAFFLPLATLSSLFGTNLPFPWPLPPGPLPFLTLVGAGLVMGLILSLFMKAPRT